MPGTGQKICVGVVVGVCKPIIVFSLVQAEQNGVKFQQGANGTIVRTLSDPQDHILTSGKFNLNLTL